jgi:hypothetical protein
MDGPSQHVHFSLTHGGFLYEVLRRLRVIRGDPSDARRKALVLAAVPWGILVVLQGVEGVVSGSSAPLLKDFSVHVRLLVALPLLVLAEATLEARCRVAAADISAERIPQDTAAWEAILKRAARLRDAWTPELLFLVGIAAAAQVAWWAELGAPPGDRTPAHAWHRLAALPFFQFLLLRTIWQWLRWAHILFRLTRTPLRLMPAHPDRTGGLGHLGFPVVGIIIVIFAGSAVVSSGWGVRIMEGHTSIRQLGGPLLILLAFDLLLALGPMLVFFPHLVRLRMDGMRKYGAFAMRYTSAFHSRWITPRTAGTEDPLKSQDIQALADLAGSFSVVESMRVAPFGRRAIYIVLVAALLPMVPLVFTEMSLAEVIRTVAGALLGGPAMEAG